MSVTDIQATSLTTEDAAKDTGIAVSTLKQWRCTGEGPVFVKVGRSVRYLKSDIDAFLASRRVTSTMARRVT